MSVRKNAQIGSRMKTKVEKLAKGIIEKCPPELEVSVDSLKISLQTGTEIDGCIEVFSTNGASAKGLFYSDNTRIILEEEKFVGEKAQLHYKVNAVGMAAGDKLTGALHIVSDGGEIAIPYEIAVEAPYIETEMGRVYDLFHFTNLVKKNYDEAVHIFTSDDFERIFLARDSIDCSVCESLKGSSSIKTALEEFLVYANKKARVRLEAETKKEYHNLEETYGDVLQIKKENWGYTELSFHTDADFIKLSAKQATSEEFAGNLYELSYLIKAEKLHAGMNTGHIFVKTPYQEICCELTVEREYRDAAKHRVRGQVKNDCMSLAGYYFDFRLHRISTESWCKKSNRKIEHIRSLEYGLGEIPLEIELMHAQVLVVQKRLHEAGRILDRALNRLEQMQDTESTLYCYYQYVKSLFLKNPESVKVTAARIKEIYDRGNSGWQMLWVLLYMDEEYALNKSLRIARIKEQFTKGCRSPFLYYEACAVINEQPQLLRVLNSFEQQALWWGCRYEAVSEKTAIQTAELANMEKRCTPILFRILTALYTKYKNKFILESLLSLLLRNGMTSAAFFPWFSEGILQNITLTGIYEAYMSSLPEDFEESFPRVLKLYFAFDNSLNEELKTRLYENVLRYSVENTAILKNYASLMERFVMEQIKKGRINKRLSYLYKKVVSKTMLDTDLAEKYLLILMTQYLKCENKEIRHIIVRHKELNEEQRIPLLNGVAYFPVYTEDCIIILEDEKGRRFYEHCSYQRKALMSGGEMLRHCHMLCEGDILLWLHLCERQNSTDVELYKKAVEYPKLRQVYRNQLFQKIIEYYTDNYDAEQLEETLRQLHMGSIEPEESKQLAELLITRAMYGEAYELIEKHGYEGIAPNRLLKICIKRIWDNDMQKDEALIEICTHVFFKGKYEESILNYLLRYYYGSTKNMLKLWQAACDFDVDTSDLEERLLVQILFTGTYVSKAFDVFAEYYKNGVNQTVIVAYLVNQSYMYFIKETLVPERIFEMLEIELKNGHELAQVCHFALLKFYSEQSSLNGTQEKLMWKLLKQAVDEDYLFGFFKKFETYGMLPLCLRDKAIVEYRAQGAGHVEIHYTKSSPDGQEDGYEIMPMQHVYENIYIASFILFYGESFQYFITEEERETSGLTQSDSITSSEWCEKYGESRYQLLNDICASSEMHDMKTWHNLMQLYEKQMHWAEEYFKPMD